MEENDDEWLKEYKLHTKPSPMLPSKATNSSYKIIE
jgi:hypothetical protein